MVRQLMKEIRFKDRFSLDIDARFPRISNILSKDRFSLDINARFPRISNILSEIINQIILSEIIKQI
jgi:hypothetical protein